MPNFKRCEAMTVSSGRCRCGANTAIAVNGMWYSMCNAHANEKMRLGDKEFSEQQERHFHLQQIRRSNQRLLDRRRSNPAHMNPF